MQEILQQITSGEVVFTLAASFVTFVLGLATAKWPKKVAAINGIAGETGEAILEIASAVRDGKILPGEAHEIFKECRDVYDAVRRVRETQAQGLTADK